MGRVAVIFPPLAVSRDFIDYPYFADLGAVQAAAVLAASGHEVQLIDALALAGADAVDQPGGRILLGAPTMMERLGPSELALVAFTPFHRPPRRDAELGALLQQLRAQAPERPIVLADLYQSGQHYVEADPARVLEEYPEVDLLLRYEAEGNLPEVVSELLRGRPDSPRVLRGVEPAELDALPLPAWDRVDLAAYFAFHERVMERLGRPRWAFPIDSHSLPLITSRGCPFHCVHCSSNPGLIDGQPKTQRRKSRARMARELDFLVSLGARRVHVLDELTNVNERHFDDLLQLVADRDLRLEIPNGLRADYVTDRHLALLSGRTTTLSVSAESGVQRVLDQVVNKELDLSSITGVAERAQAAGVPLLVHFMLGLPGETRAEINQTLAFASDLFERFGAEPSVQYATPLPGTALARSLRSLPVVDDWSPRFQQVPSATLEGTSPDELAAFRGAFEDRLRVLRSPKRATLQVTFECNNRCSFCTTGTRAQRRVPLSRLLELLGAARARGADEVELDGGEPTLHPQLFELIREARRLGFSRVGLITNARRAYYPDYAARLATSGLTHIAVSIHGPNPAVHGAIVGDPDAFEQTLAGARNLLASAPGDVRISATLTLTRDNLLYLLESAALVHEVGLRKLELCMTLPFGAESSAVAPDPEVAAVSLVRLIDAWHDRLDLCVSNLPWCFMPRHARYIAPDNLMLESHRWVEGTEAPTFEYWRAQREHRPQCATCVRRVFCGGFFRTTAAEDPTWLRRETVNLTG